MIMFTFSVLTGITFFGEISSIWKFDIQYLENLHDLHNVLPFLPERMKVEKVKKLVEN